MTRRLVQPGSVLVGLLLLTAIGTLAQSDQNKEKNIVKAFSKAVNEYIPAHIPSGSQVIHVRCGYNKRHYEASTEHNIDVRKTDSLVSPYIGIVTFRVITHLSGCHPTTEEAEKDETDAFQFDGTHRYTFAYQDDAWLIKTREIGSGLLSKMYPCEPLDGCI